MNAAELVVYLSTGEIAARFGTTAKRVGLWVRDGVNGPGGARVRLDARKIGGRYRATEAAVEAFLRACDGREAPPVSETEAARARRVARDLADAERLLYPRGSGQNGPRAARAPGAARGATSPGGLEPGVV